MTPMQQQANLQIFVTYENTVPFFCKILYNKAKVIGIPSKN